MKPKSGRLRPPRTDPLEEYGLPSKGETRLNDLRTQEQFFSIIQEKCRKSQLLEPLSSLALDCSPKTQGVEADSSSSHLLKSVASPNERECSRLLSAMRKLREAIVATRRHDAFAANTYMFIIRAAILMNSWEAYQPALRYLLDVIHRQKPLKDSQVQEFVKYLVLDAACRRKDVSDAYIIQQAFSLQDSGVARLLKALARNTWTQYWATVRVSNVFDRRLMLLTAPDVQRQVIGCLSAAYFTSDVHHVEFALGDSWANITDEGKVSWELEGQKVVFRRPKSVR